MHKHTKRFGIITRAGFNLLLAGLWLWLYRPVLDYLTLIYAREDFRTNQIALIGVLVLVIARRRKDEGRWRIDAAPHLHPHALGLMLGCTLAYLLLERYLDINILSAICFGVGSYGLLGLWMSPSHWRERWLVAALIIATLPFGEHLQTFVGYPLRILTARIVRDGLHAAGLPAIGIDTILVLENGVSKIDLPCSGVRSLWTGMLFFLAATWIEHRPVNWRWMGTAVIFIGLLLVANTARIAVLVVVDQVLNWHFVAEMIHAPLGILGFAIACAVGVALPRWLQPSTPPPPQPATDDTHPHPAWLSPALNLLLLTFILLYAPRPQTGLAHSGPLWAFPDTLSVQAQPLRPDEIAWFTRDGAEAADRYHFTWHDDMGDINGTLLLITSKTWRAHHRPERCFEVYGLQVDASASTLIASNFPVREVTLRRPGHASTQHAAYWFQSATTVTDDYGARVWDDVGLKPKRWVLISVTFDAGDADTNELYHAL